MNDEQTDHEGRAIPDDEPVDAVIRVWEVEPHPSNSRTYDSYVERSWQRMLGFVKDNLDIMLESRELDELLEEPFVLKIRLREMVKRDYLDIVEGE